MRFNQISDYFYREVQPFFKGEFDDSFIIKHAKPCPISLDFNSLNIQTAFIHRSFKNENKINLNHNETLEFLGDSVLQIFISKTLIEKFPDKSEGELSKMRSAIVNEDSLCRLSLLCHFDRCVLLGKGELKEEGYFKKSILSDCFEAVLGGLYLDGGESKAFKFLEEVILYFENKTKKTFYREDLSSEFDAKSKLQEITMKKFKTTPIYNCSEIEENKKKLFHIELVLEGKPVDSIKWPSKKKGMQELAKRIIEKNII